MTINCVGGGGSSGQATAGDVDRMFAVTLYRVPPPQPQPSLGRSHISGIRVGRNSEHDEERSDPGLLLWGMGGLHLLKLSFKILFVQFLPCFAQHVLSLHQGRHSGFGAPDTNNHLSSSQPFLTVFVL